jgi:hypothetical protein
VKPYWKPEHPPPCTNTRFAILDETDSGLDIDAL